jgi:hypothetical protein
MFGMRGTLFFTVGRSSGWSDANIGQEREKRKPQSTEKDKHIGAEDTELH